MVNSLPLLKMLSSEFGIFDWNTFSLSSLIITSPGIIFDLDLIYSFLPELNFSILATLTNLIHLANLINLLRLF